MQIKLNLPLNTVNSKKPRMPNVANRVDAIVSTLLPITHKLNLDSLFANHEPLNQVPQVFP